jgi:hypothetical protein
MIEQEESADRVSRAKRFLALNLQTEGQVKGTYHQGAIVHQDATVKRSVNDHVKAASNKLMDAGADLLADLVQGELLFLWLLFFYSSIIFCGEPPTPICVLVFLF